MIKIATTGCAPNGSFVLNAACHRRDPPLPQTRAEHRIYHSGVMAKH